MDPSVGAPAWAIVLRPLRGLGGAGFHRGFAADFVF